MAIGKLTKGSDAGGLMAYLTQDNDQAGELRDRAEIIGGTVLGDTAKAAADELSDLKALRPSLEKNMAHMSIRLHEDDRDMSDAEWLEAADMWATGMGFESYAVVSHGDHIHIAASRIKIDGSVVSDSHDWRRSEQLVRDIEERFDLIRVESSHLLDWDKSADHRKGPTLAEIAMAERGEVPIKARLQDRLDELVNQEGGITASDFVKKLTSYGVDVRPNVASTGRLNGFSYGYGGVSWTAKELGRGFSLKNMIERGLNYEQDRDFQTLREASERSREQEHIRGGRRTEGGHPGPGEPEPASRGAGQPDHDSDRPGTRADRNSRAATEPSRRGADRIIEERDQQDRKPGEEVSREGREDSPGAEGPDREYEGHGGQSEPSTPEVGGRQGEPDTGAIRNEGGSSEGPENTRSSARSRGRSTHSGSSMGGMGSGVDSGAAVMLEGDGFAALMAFFRRWSSTINKASNTPMPKVPQYQPEPGSVYASIMRSGAKARAAQIRESKAIEQMKGFGCAKFEIQDIPPKVSKEKPGQVRKLSPEGVIKHLDYMASQNAKGRDIYIRPAPVEINGETHAQPYIFVDDLSKAHLAKLDELGLPLAIQVESSPNNYHGWVRVGDKPLTTAEATMAAKIIAKAVGADEGAADWRHHGRMAGFTNQKPSRRTSKGAPFVKMTTSKNMDIARNGPALVKAAQQRLAKEAEAKAAREVTAAEQARKSREASTRQELRDRLQGQDVFAHVADARERHRRGTDESRTDLSAALSALRAGFHPEDIKDAIRACSPDLEERHQDVDRYLNKTLDRAEDYIRQDPGHRRP